MPDLEYGDAIPIAGRDRIAQPAVKPGVPRVMTIGATSGTSGRNQLRVDGVRGRGGDDDGLVVVEMALGGTLGSDSGLKLKRTDTYTTSTKVDDESELREISQHLRD